MTFTSFIPCIIMFALLLLRVPVAFALIIPTRSTTPSSTPRLPIEIVVQSMSASMESFPYLAIPFFTCAGWCSICPASPTGSTASSNLLVGHMRGGLAQINVLMSAMMGGLSGSASADAAMDSKTVVPQMLKQGYSKGFSTVVTAASSVVTPIIPPGIILILYSLMRMSRSRACSWPVTWGILLTIALMITVRWIAVKRGYAPARDGRATRREIWSQVKQSSWALMLPVFLIVGMRFGAFTATEAGAMAVLYALFVGVVVYRELNWSHVPQILVESVDATASVMFIVAAAHGPSAATSPGRHPHGVTNLLLNNVSSPWMLLLIINIFLLFVGFFFEGGAAMVLLAPILVPAVKAMGIDLVHFGIVMSVNLTIAGFTPPVGTMISSRWPSPRRGWKSM